MENYYIVGRTPFLDIGSLTSTNYPKKQDDVRNLTLKTEKLNCKKVLNNGERLRYLEKGSDDGKSTERSFAFAVSGHILVRKFLFFITME